MYQCQKCGKEFESKYELTWTKDCHGIPFRHVCYECYDKLMGNGYDGQYYDELDENLDLDY